MSQVCCFIQLQSFSFVILSLQKFHHLSFVFSLTSSSVFIAVYLCDVLRCGLKIKQQWTTISTVNLRFKKNPLGTQLASTVISNCNYASQVREGVNVWVKSVKARILIDKRICKSSLSFQKKSKKYSKWIKNQRKVSFYCLINYC